MPTTWWIDLPGRAGNYTDTLTRSLLSLSQKRFCALIGDLNWLIKQTRPIVASGDEYNCLHYHDTTYQGGEC